MGPGLTLPARRFLGGALGILLVLGVALFMYLRFVGPARAEYAAAQRRLELLQGQEARLENLVRYQEDLLTLADQERVIRARLHEQLLQPAPARPPAPAPAPVPVPAPAPGPSRELLRWASVAATFVLLLLVNLWPARRAEKGAGESGEVTA